MGTWNGHWVAVASILHSFLSKDWWIQWNGMIFPDLFWTYHFQGLLTCDQLKVFMRLSWQLASHLDIALLWWCSKCQTSVDASKHQGLRIILKRSLCFSALELDLKTNAFGDEVSHSVIHIPCFPRRKAWAWQFCATRTRCNEINGLKISSKLDRLNWI